MICNDTRNSGLELQKPTHIYAPGWKWPGPLPQCPEKPAPTTSCLPPRCFGSTAPIPECGLSFLPAPWSVAASSPVMQQQLVCTHAAEPRQRLCWPMIVELHIKHPQKESTEKPTFCFPSRIKKTCWSLSQTLCFWSSLLSCTKHRTQKTYNLLSWVIMNLSRLPLLCWLLWVPPQTTPSGGYCSGRLLWIPASRRWMVQMAVLVTVADISAPIGKGAKSPSIKTMTILTGMC